ncbi:MAG: ImmA/IrrE family metallo-endopeptidase [Rhizobium sp.]
MGSSIDFVVPPRSWDSIHGVATRVREVIGLEHLAYIPVVDVLEKVLDQKMGLVRFEIGDYLEMEGAEGLTDPTGHFIQIREDVYTRALAGDGRARFTVAHELGHFFLHTGIPLARSFKGDGVQIFSKSEPQANQFAAEFLMPRSQLWRGISASEVAANHGVSDEAARNRCKFMSGRGLI